jgi:hypothetical protein
MVAGGGYDARMDMTLPAAIYLAVSADPWGGEDSLFDKYPWAWDMLLFFLAVGLVAVMIWFAKSARPARGFVIHVDEDDITFTGQFPTKMQALVIQFLRNDVALSGRYEIRGHWEDRLLVVVVIGDQAQPMEQRIRNFLKLHLKPA